MIERHKRLILGSGEALQHAFDHRGNRLDRIAPGLVRDRPDQHRPGDHQGDGGDPRPFPLETEETTAGMDRTPRARPTTKRVSGSMTDMLPLVTQWGDYSGSVL